MRMMLVVGLAVSTTGCAWMFKGSKQEVEFISVPGEADVRLDARYLGATPTKAEIDRNASQNILVTKEGYADQHARVQRHPDTAWWFWDIGTCVVPVTLCIPLLVDAISGAWFSLDDDVRVKLDALPQSKLPVQVGTRPAPAPSYASPGTEDHPANAE